MKSGKILAALLVAAVLAVPGNLALAEEAAAPAATAKAEAGPVHFYESQGLKLKVPEAYDKLLLTETTPDQQGRFFAVTEKASVEAAQKEGGEATGAGWIFSLERLTEKEILRNIRRIDKNRRQTREILTGKSVSDGSTFDLTVNATDWDIKKLAEAVAEFSTRWFER